MNEKNLPDQSEIVAILSEQKRSRSRSKLYPEVNREMKIQALSEDVLAKAKSLEKPTEKVNLHDLEAVKSRTVAYMQACADAGCFPSSMGLASLGFGCSRQWIDEFFRTHKGSPSADFLERTKDCFADILSNAALNRHVSEVVSIFILKNCNGFSDRLEITPAPPENPLGNDPDMVALEAKLQDIVVDE